MASMVARLAGAICARIVGFPPAPRVDGKFKNWREQYLLERNALFTIYKNYDDDNCRRAPGGDGAVRCGEASRSEASTRTRSISSGVQRRGRRTIAMPKSTAASVFAVDAFVENISLVAGDPRRDPAAVAAR